MRAFLRLDVLDFIVYFIHAFIRSRRIKLNLTMSFWFEYYLDKTSYHIFPSSTPGARIGEGGCDRLNVI